MLKKTIYFGSSAHLSLQDHQLLITPRGAPKRTSHYEPEPAIRPVTRSIEELAAIIIDSPQVSLTSALMATLLDYNVAVIFCNDTHLPSGLMLPLSGHTLQNERFRAQIDASLPLKKQLWQQTIRAKILNQAAVISHITGKEHGCLLAWAREVRSGDPDNLEGRAAAYYWKNLFNIDYFTRRRDGITPNNLLNYGYAILRGIIARSLVSSGLLPTLGIHHHNKYNAYCLADDIMEPYRPYVDELVAEIVRESPNLSELTPEIKAKLINVTSIDVQINKHISPLMVAATTTSSSLAKCFCGESRVIQYPIIQP